MSSIKQGHMQMIEGLSCCHFLTLPLNEEGIRWQPQLIFELHKTLLAKCLSEYVCHLLICLNVLQPNGSSLYTVSQEVVPNVYVFTLVMEHWILR